jgi:hypothetical protein
MVELGREIRGGTGTLIQISGSKLLPRNLAVLQMVQALLSKISFSISRKKEIP